MQMCVGQEVLDLLQVQVLECQRSNASSGASCWHWFLEIKTNSCWEQLDSMAQQVFAAVESCCQNVFDPEEEPEPATDLNQDFQPPIVKLVNIFSSHHPR